MALRYLLGGILCAGLSSLTAQSCESNGAAVLQVAEEYVGVREATGHNDGPVVGYFLQCVQLSEGYPWCGAFIYATFKDAGVGVPGGARAFAWAPSWHPPERRVWTRSYGNNNKFQRLGKKEPMPGDVFGLYYSNLKRIGHVGILERIDGKYAITIEGNTSGGGSREGDGVYGMRRRLDQLYCISRWVC